MSKKRVLLAAAALLVLAIVGCGSDHTMSRESMPTGSDGSNNGAGGDQADMMSMCPVTMPGTTVSVSNTETGVALNFVTATGSVADLRQRVLHMAEMHNAHGGGGSRGVDGHAGERMDDHAGEMMDGHNGGMMGGECRGMMQGGGHGNGRMMMVPATATVEDIDGGARIVFLPRDPSTLENLREQVRQCAESVTDGDCPMGMMRGGMGGDDSGDEDDPGGGGDDGHGGHH